MFDGLLAGFAIVIVVTFFAGIAATWIIPWLWHLLPIALVWKP